MRVSAWTGRSGAFAAALAVVLLWVASGPLFHFSDTWQLVINTGTTIVTFLMVFLIQRAQNKESRAIHLKLDEIVAALAGASNRLIDAESLTEHEIDVLRKHYSRISHGASAPSRVPEAEAGPRPPRPRRDARRKTQ